MKKDKKMIIGYTTGVFDLFHIGHLNLLRNARSLCDRLVVGLSTDELAQYKNKKPVIPFQERMEILGAIKYVDAVIPQENMDKYQMWEKVKFSIMFVGDDWHETEKWKEIEMKLNDVGVNVVYFPYTKGTSSTLINNVLNDLRSNK